MTLQLRKRSLFPALVQATSPLVLTKVGATYTFSLDESALELSLDTTLQALAAIDSTAGLLTQTGVDTFTKRTLTGTANEITATNGDGVSGNPTLSLPTALTFTGKTVTGGTFSSPSLTTPTITTSYTLNIGSDSAVGATFNGAGGNSRLTFGVSTNPYVRSQNSLQLKFGINTTDSAALESDGLFSAGVSGLTTGRLKLYGGTSGSTIVTANTGAASGTLTLPAATDTLVGKATTDVLTNKTLDSAGTGNVLKVSSVTVSAGQYPGTTTNDSATAGNNGEYVSSTIASGSAVALTTATPANITSISLTAGDWDVWVNARFTGGATTTVSRIITSFGTTTAALDATPGRIGTQFYNGAVVFNVATVDLSAGPARISLSGTTTLFLVCQAEFGVSTCSAYGIIQARRRR